MRTMSVVGRHDAHVVDEHVPTKLGASRRGRARLGAVMALALIVRLAYVFGYSRHAQLGFDGNHYYELARRISDHFSYDDTELAKATALFPPGYPAILAIGRAVGMGTRTKLLVFSCGLGTLTVGLIVTLTRRYANETSALSAGVIAALYPNLFLADGALMTETLTALLIAGALLLALRWLAHPGWPCTLTLSVILGWYCLTRSDGIVFSLLLVGVLAWRSRRRGAPRVGAESPGMAKVSALLLIPVVVLAAWQIRIQREMHAFVPVAVNGWAVIAGANCDLTYHGHRIGSWELPCVKVVEAAERGHIGEVAQNRYARDRGLDYVRAHVSELPKVVAARLGRTFGIFQPWHELEIESFFEGRSDWWSKVGYLMYLVLIPFALIGVAMQRSRAHGERSNLDLCCVPLIAVMVSVAAAYGNHRFRIPIEPLLVMFAAIGAEGTLVRLKHRNSMAVQ